MCRIPLEAWLDSTTEAAIVDEYVNRALQIRALVKPHYRRTASLQTMPLPKRNLPQVPGYHGPSRDPVSLGLVGPFWNGTPSGNVVRGAPQEFPWNENHIAHVFASMHETYWLHPRDATLESHSADELYELRHEVGNRTTLLPLCFANHWMLGVVFAS